MKDFDPAPELADLRRGWATTTGSPGTATASAPRTSSADRPWMPGTPPACGCSSAPITAAGPPIPASRQAPATRYRRRRRYLAAEIAASSGAPALNRVRAPPDVTRSRRRYLIGGQVLECVRLAGSLLRVHHSAGGTGCRNRRARLDHSRGRDARPAAESACPEPCARRRRAVGARLCPSRERRDLDVLVALGRPDRRHGCRRCRHRRTRSAGSRHVMTGQPRHPLTVKRRVPGEAVSSVLVEGHLPGRPCASVVSRTARHRRGCRHSRQVLQLNRKDNPHVATRN